MTDTPEPGRLSRWWRHYRQRISFTGLAVGMVFLWLTATPSLLPRGPIFQGLLSGAGAALGYCLGALAAWLGRYLVSRDRRWDPPRPVFWWVLTGCFVVGTAASLYGYSVWQAQLRDLMGAESLEWWTFLVVIAVAALVFVLLMVLGQAWASLVKFTVGRINRVAPPRMAAAAGTGVILLITIFVVNGMLPSYVMSSLDASFALANNETSASSEPPTSELRSGGPGSLVSWDSLGREGRDFVSHGPDVAELTEFNGEPAVEPIRVFTGLDSAGEVRDRAELAADELVRAGGLERQLIAIGSTTGSGWINQATVDSLEYMYNGDVATVAMQYSYLPSPLSFLTDSERARQAGSALFEAVDARVQELPEADRPLVVVFGESLGSFGGEAAFGTAPTIAARTDGALFAGPTSNNTLWRDITEAREDGSPEILPIYQDGEHVRFVAEVEDLTRPDEPWETTRVVYLQHASDPITWWSPDLLLAQPDWLAEPRGDDVLGAVRWIPFVTFLQVAADMAVSTGVPDGHGHNYRSIIPWAWSDILSPPGWTDEKTEELIPRLSRDVPK